MKSRLPLTWLRLTRFVTCSMIVRTSKETSLTATTRPNLFVRCFISAAMELLGLTVGGDASAGAVVRLRRCSVST